MSKTKITITCPFCGSIKGYGMKKSTGNETDFEAKPDYFDCYEAMTKFSWEYGDQALIKLIQKWLDEKMGMGNYKVKSQK